MENKLIINFNTEKEKFKLDISQPDLAELVHFIIEKNIIITQENISIDTENENFDTDEFLEVLVSVHGDFKSEIDDFYNNIENEISTYYSDEELSKKIIEKIKTNS